MPSGDELVIWQEVVNNSKNIYALGDVSGTEEGVLQHQYQIAWLEGTLELIHCDTSTMVPSDNDWGKGNVNMLPVVTVY